jgi:hypothetical protein
MIYQDTNNNDEAKVAGNNNDISLAAILFSLLPILLSPGVR